jgi:hypothetical protein
MICQDLSIGNKESTKCCKQFGYLGEDEDAYVGLEERRKNTKTG